jgi:hypothetical protein
LRHPASDPLQRATCPLTSLAKADQPPRHACAPDEKQSFDRRTQHEATKRTTTTPVEQVDGPTMPRQRGNIVAPLAVPYASDASAKPRYLDNSDAPERILRPRTRLRALWANGPWWFESTRAHEKWLEIGVSRSRRATREVR